VGLAFAKLQGAGNGYLAVDGRAARCDWSALAIAMTQHRLGVGSDGLLVVQHSDIAAVRMRVFNSDGSEAEMSGNGIRLFAKFVLDREMAKPNADGLRIQTGGGLRTVVPTLVEGRVVSARVAMGIPTFTAAEIPVDSTTAGGAERIFDFPLEVAGRTIPINCLSLGNPHAVAILEEPVDEFPLAEVGPAVVNHPMFPNRINFEIVNVLARDVLRARIFERGEGETLSSGTGSTASAVAARAHGFTDDTVEVRLRGGRLRVEWAGQGEALLEGPAVEVFTGVWPLA
jgi:diaminopimelate epimerase